MMDRDDEEPVLRNYIQSLPAGPRPARDHGIRRQRLLPSLQAYAQREYRRVRRHRSLLRVATATIIGGATVVAALWVGLPSQRSEPSDRNAPGVSAAAALTVLDGALLLESGGIARTLHTGDSVGLAEVRAFEASSDLPARVRLSDVVALTLAPSSRVRPIATGGGLPSRVPPALEVIALERGRVHLQVKKLGDMRRFHVVTPDADVEVRGTVFDVVLRPGAVPKTCVSVDEGLVLVASGLESHLLSRGETWGCGDSPANTPTAQRTSPVSPSASPRDRTSKASAKRPALATRSAAPRTEDDVSDLGAQNQLFQRALAAERAGRFDDAARTYRQLLMRAPHGPLAAQTRANLAAVSSPRR